MELKYIPDEKTYHLGYVKSMLESNASTIDRENPDVVRKIAERAKNILFASTIVKNSLYSGLTEEKYYKKIACEYTRDYALDKVLIELLNKRVEELTTRLEKYECVETEI